MQLLFLYANDCLSSYIVVGNALIPEDTVTIAHLFYKQLQSQPIFLLWKSKSPKKYFDTFEDQFSHPRLSQFLLFCISFAQKVLCSFYLHIQTLYYLWNVFLNYIFRYFSYFICLVLFLRNTNYAYVGSPAKSFIPNVFYLQLFVHCCFSVFNLFSFLFPFIMTFRKQNNFGEYLNNLAKFLFLCVEN